MSLKNLDESKGKGQDCDKKLNNVETLVPGELPPCTAPIVCDGLDSSCLSCHRVQKADFSVITLRMWKLRFREVKYLV